MKVNYNAIGFYSYMFHDFHGLSLQPDANQTLDIQNAAGVCEQVPLQLLDVWYRKG